MQAYELANMNFTTPMETNKWGIWLIKIGGKRINPINWTEWICDTDGEQYID